MKNIINKWWFWVILLVVLIALATFFASKLSLSSVGIEELNCQCSENIKCSSGFRCVILEGEVCGHCAKIGGGGTGSTSGGGTKGQ